MDLQISKAKKFSQKMLPYWIAAAITALISIGYASAFRWSEQIAFEHLGVENGLVFLVVPLAILASALMAEVLSPVAAGSGIPQLIAAMELSRTQHGFLGQLLGIPMIIVKILGSCICIMGGGVTGREGPNLHVSAAIFYQIHRFWPKASETINLQSMVLAGGAAGLAAAFNTPLGGIIFAIEELAKVHISHIRTTVFYAVIISGLLVRAIMGNYLYLGKASVTFAGGLEIFMLAIAAALIGVMGALFGKWLIAVLGWRVRQSFQKRLLMSIVMGLSLAGLIFFLGRPAFGSGREIIIQLLNSQLSDVPWFLGFVRGIGNFLTYGGGVVGGVFAPALSTGAGLGAFFAGIFPSTNLQMWVLVGMVAFLTGVTRTPLTSMILVFEMTDSHDMIVILMLGAMLARGGASFIDKESFYEHASKRWLKAAEKWQSQKEVRE